MSNTGLSSFGNLGVGFLGINGGGSGNSINVYSLTVGYETDTLNLPLIKKNILLFFLGNNPIQEVESSPSVGQYTYNMNTGVFVFGTTIYTDTFIQILNRPI